MYASILIPDAVVLELDMGRLLRGDTLDPRMQPWASVIPIPAAALQALPANHLGSGERAVIACARMQQGAIAGLDDRQARDLAESLGLRVTGTLGVLLRARQVGLVTQVRPLLDALIRQGFRLGPALYDDGLRLAGELR